MPHPFLRPVSAMVLALAAGGPAATAATPIRTPRPADPAQVGRALTHLRSLQTQLGLDGSADFQVSHAFLSPQGRTIVHFNQLHQGVPVWNGMAIVHVEADGTISQVVNGLLTGIQLTGGPALSAAQASALAVKNLAAKGPMPVAPAVKAVVFPSRRTGGFATKPDPVTGRATLDPEYSVLAKAPVAPFVWAYEVKTSLRNPKDGMKQVAYVIDASTGAILRKWNDLRSDTAAQGTGAGLYNGAVVLDMTQATDGTYSLIDPTRGGLSDPNYVTNTSGLTIAYDYITMYPWGGYETPLPYTGSPSSAWGDGSAFTDTGTEVDASGDFWWQGADTVPGQTNAVDALFGLQKSWDLFQNVFGVNGMDNNGSSMMALVHPFAPTMDGSIQPMDYHLSFGSMLIFGDGGPARGRGAQTELDIVGHEMVHSFTMAVPQFYYQGESGALEEATSDILGKMVQAYAQPSGGGGSIPAFPATDAAGLKAIWSFAYHADQSPERYYYQPSLDGSSPDGWYDGIGVLWPWFSSGPLNRMFFFLVNGTSATPGDPNYSAYLPVATTGLGNDTAAQIWFAAVMGFMTPTTGLQDAQVAAVAAATQLYGAASDQVAQVENAFAAVNIGDAPGQPKRVKVTFPVVNPADSVIGQGGTAFYPAGTDSQYQFFPTHTPVKVQIDVQNAANPAVDWTLGTPAQGLSGGVVDTDGTWMTPAASSGSSSEPYILVATSVQDPNQFAVGSVLVVDIDADSDTVTDAMDLGQIAASWGLTNNNPFPTTELLEGGQTTDWSIAMFNQVINSAWPVQ